MFSKLFLALVVASCVVSKPTTVAHPRGPSEVLPRRKHMPFNVKFNMDNGKTFAQRERERAQRFMKGRSLLPRQDDNDTVPVANAIVSPVSFMIWIILTDRL